MLVCSCNSVNVGNSGRSTTACSFHLFVASSFHRCVGPIGHCPGGTLPLRQLQLLALVQQVLLVLML
jgi:hypothetical protein